MTTRSLLLLVLSCLTWALLVPKTQAKPTAAWELAGSQPVAQRPFSVNLMVREAQITGAVPIPRVEGLIQLGEPIRSSQSFIINNQAYHAETITLRFRSVRAGSFTLPSLKLETDQGRVKVKAFSFEVLPADATPPPSSSNSAVSLDQVAVVRLSTSKPEVWQGEIFELRYDQLQNNSFFVRWLDPQLTNMGLIIQDWLPPRRINDTINGVRMTGQRSVAPAMASRPGSLTLPAINHRVAIGVGRAGFFNLDTEEFDLSTGPTPLIVKPLPSPAPASFTGAVGEFLFDSKLVPARLHVGEPITWTLTIRGTGNWPLGFTAPPRSVPSTMKSLSPQTRITHETLPRSNKEDRFSATLQEDLILIPSQPGQFEIGPVSFSYFDPTQGKYQTRELPAIQVVVEPSVQTTTTQFAGPTSPVDRLNPRVQRPTDPIAQLPRPPRPGMLLAQAPQQWPGPLTTLLTAAFLFAFGWLTLGAVRAWLNHPATAQRRALRRAQRALQQIRPKDVRALLDWQQALTQACGGSPTALSWPRVMDYLGKHAPDQVKAWQHLWNRAEAALFDHQPLPADWVAQARTLHQQFPFLRHSPAPWPQRLRPWAPGTLVILLLGGSCLNLTAQAPADVTVQVESDALAAFRQGRFQKAAELWRQTITKFPTDALSRTHLGTTLAQLGQDDAALAWWTSAFLLAPRHPDIAFNFRLGHQRTRTADPDLARLASGAGLAALGHLMSPAELRLAFLIGCILSALGLLAWLGPAVLQPPGDLWLRRGGLILCVIGSPLMIGMILEPWIFGRLAQPNTALVVATTSMQVLPSDLPPPLPENQTEAQAAKTRRARTIEPGTVVWLTGRYLGWRQITLRNGEVGWVRADVLTPFYQSN